MENLEIWNLISKQLAGEVSEEEALDLKRWLEADPDNKATFDKLERVWFQTANASDIKVPNVDKAWEGLDRSIDEAEPKAKVAGSYQIGFWAKMAAAFILLLVTIGLLLYKNKPSKMEAPKLSVKQEKVVQPEPTKEEQYLDDVGNEPQWVHVSSTDTMQLVILPDNSKVWLNNNSHLSYTENFRKDGIELVFDGEAFFEVEKDALHPFLIHADGMEIRVLGTSFNVNTHDVGEKDTEVMVVTGKVAISPVVNTAKKEVLTKGYRGELVKNGKSVTKHSPETVHKMKWFNKNTVINNEELISPEKYIQYGFHLKDGWPNKSVIEGKLTNDSDHVTFSHIRFMYHIYNVDGVKKGPYYFTVYEKLLPGQALAYDYGLLNIFARNDKIEVKMVGAQIVESEKNKLKNK